MTPFEHSQLIANDAHLLILKKYEKGQAEHGGQLWRKKRLLENAIDEAIDQVIYLLTLKYQLNGLDKGDLDE